MAYAYYTYIDIKASAVGTNETNFPVVLILTDSRFATVANGGRVRNTDATGGASGGLTVPADFVVSPNADGSSPYDFEFVDYNAATGYMELWIEVTSLSSVANTTIYLVYGDAGVAASQEDVAGTWNANFEAVWHLGEGAGSAEDSTGANDGSFEGSLPTPVAGQVGDCQDFDGTDDYVDAGNASFLSDTAGSMEFWIRIDAALRSPWGSADYSQNNRFFYSVLRNGGEGLNNDRLSLHHYDNGHNYALYTPEDSIFADANTYHVVITSSGTVIKIYIDSGVQALTVAQGANNGDWFGDLTGIDRFVIGGLLYDSGSFIGDWDGLIDEFRVSSSERDADWIATSYTNQDNNAPNGTFWTALSDEIKVRAPYGFII